MFTELTNDKPFLKLALQGFAGDGKTRTAAEIAIGVHKLVQSKKPIAIYDTEQAAKALKPLFDAAEIKAVSSKARTLASLNQAIKWCEEGNSDILVIDSITHVWEEFVEAYKKQKNRSSLQFQDWGVLKPMWKNQFSTPFVQANVHIIFTGRAGYEYEEEKDEQGKRSIHKSGIKMKAESETNFEPDVLVLMEKVQDVLGEKKRIYRIATILKDRSDKIDGLCLNEKGEKPGPNFGDFYPAVASLLDGTIREYAGKDIPDTFEDWESKFSYLKIKKGKVISEIDGAFKYMGLGTGANDKKLVAATLNKTFKVMSFERLEDVPLQQLEDGLSIIKDFAEAYNLYMKECMESETKPDMVNIGKILEDAIADARQELPL